MRRTVAILAVALVTVATSCSSESAPNTDIASDDLINVRMTIEPYFGFAPLLVARDAGYLRQEGFRVATVNVTSDAQVLPQLIKGQVDAVNFLLNPGLFNAMAQRADLKIVAGNGFADPDRCSYSGFVARKELADSRALAEPGGLNGLRATFAPGSLEEYLLHKVAGETGSSVSQIEVEDAEPSVYADAFSKGSLDIAHTSEPWITRLTSSDKAAFWKPVARVLPNFQTGVIVFNQNFLKKNPEAGKRFMVAYMKAVRAMQGEKTDRLVNLLAKATELEPELIRRMCWPSIRPDGGINTASVVDFQEWAKENGHLERVVRPADFWDPTFVDHANRELAKS